VVRDWLRPALVADDLLNQYAFKPTGSTECPLTNCIDLLRECLIRMNMSAASQQILQKLLDIVDHATVIRNSNALNTSASIKKLDNFLSYCMDVGRSPRSIIPFHLN
jgi:hypothetical protein